jgi:hypothetical protein
MSRRHPPGLSVQIGDLKFVAEIKKWRMPITKDQLETALDELGQQLQRDNPGAAISIHVEEALRSLVAGQAAKQIHEQLRRSEQAPPRVLWGPLVRWMSPAAYQRYCEPHIADMHQAWFDCLSRGDRGGAWRAVVWSHIVMVPTWMWAAVAHWLVKFIGLIRT